MRILHIWNTAGVAGTIAKYMDRLHGTESLVITRKKYDPFSFANSKVKTLNNGRIGFYVQALTACKKYDVVHIHSIDKVIPWIKRVNPKKPLIIHYHGSDIRGKWGCKDKYWTKADKILAATEDLLEGGPPNTLFIPNPIDINKIPSIPQKHHVAFFTSVKAGKADDLAESLASKYGLPIEIHSRDDTPLPHQKYLEKIASYEYFIDVRREYNQPGVYEVFSLGALEALAAGCKIIDWNGNIHEGLPQEHHPENVAKKLYTIYQEVLTCS